MRITEVGNGKVVLIAGGGKVYTDVAARFCRSEKSLDEIIATPYNRKLVETIIKSGHGAAMEFDWFIFGVEGYSRVTETQLVRKRHASYLIKSGRAELGGKRSFDVVLPTDPKLDRVLASTDLDIDQISLTNEETGELVELSDALKDRYTKDENWRADIHIDNYQLLGLMESFYDRAVAEGVKEEDARYYKPQATMFKAIIGMNSRALNEWFRIRCCCYDEQTEVLTKEGWKFFRDLTPDDVYYSLNPLTHECEFVKAKRIIENEYDGDMVSVKSQSIDLLVTPNHKFYVSYASPEKKYLAKGSTTGQFELEYAAVVPEHNIVRMKKNCYPIAGIQTDKFVIPGTEVLRTNQHASWVRKIESKIVDIRKFMSFLGMYISDGYCCKVGDHYNVGICKGDRYTIDKYYNILCELTDNTPRIIKDDRYQNDFWKVEVHDRRLYEYLKKLGKVYDKHIPKEIFEYDHTILLYLLEGLMNGDGSYNSKNDCMSFTTSSVRLKDDFQRLALHLGFSSSITRGHTKGQLGGIIDGRQIVHKADSYSLSLNRKKNEPIIKNNKRDPFYIEHYSGKIHCVELERNHILYVRRNGKCVWCGNSRAQEEIRDLATKMMMLCKKAAPDLFMNAGPSCVEHGFCPELEQCEERKGVVPTYEQYERFKKENPKYKEFLKELMNS